MKKNRLAKQIMIGALIIVLFAVGIFTVSLFWSDASVTVLAVKDADGATAAVYTAGGSSTGADCPVYSLGDQKYLALFYETCSLAHEGRRNEAVLIRRGNEGEIEVGGIKGTRPVEKAQTDGKEYEFFGGEISFYPFENGWISAIFLMNHAGNAAYECVRFGNIEMTAKEYHDAFGEAGGYGWDAENEVYTDEMGQTYKTRSAHAHEVPALYRTQETDGYVSFYLTAEQYESLMEEKVFELRDAEQGYMNALFWEKE